MRLLTEKKGTKISVLQSSARIYDPLRFLKPFTIRVKHMFQEMWESGGGMKNCHQIWPKNGNSGVRTQLHRLTIPRWYQINMQQENNDALELHVFCDASEKAYSTVAYLLGKKREEETIIIPWSHLKPGWLL